MRIVANLVARIGPHRVSRGLGFADDVPRLQDRIRAAVANHPEIGELRTRRIEHQPSFGDRKTETENSCIHCGREVRRLHHHGSYATEDPPVAEIELRLDDEVLAALEGHAGTWAVWDEIPKGAKLHAVV